jgi:N-acyl homoserine lactone hydrolase
MISIKSLVTTFCLFLSIVWAGKAFSDSNIKSYTIYCGTLDVSDISVLSSDGEYDGQKTKMVNPCFLIRHPKGDLLWDTGHIDSMADNPNGEVNGVWHSKLRIKLIAQLNQLGISPKDIEYLSLSHVHPDHAGNANKFVDSTFIINELERKYMFSAQAKSMFGEFYSALENSKTITFKTEYDVFNDDSVIIKSMPGHTPGSSVLLVRLGKSGNVLLTGDLYLHARGRALGTMFQYNDKQLTTESREKFENLAKKEDARVIIQHEIKDFVRLPKSPKFLD